jgi:hypothetical protein
MNVRSLVEKSADADPVLFSNVISSDPSSIEEGSHQWKKGRING